MVPGAELHTIEIDDELEDFIREHLCQAQQGKNIHLHIGDARDIIPQVGGSSTSCLWMPIKDSIWNTTTWCSTM